MISEVGLRVFRRLPKISESDLGSGGEGGEGLWRFPQVCTFENIGLILMISRTVQVMTVIFQTARALEQIQLYSFYYYPINLVISNH